MIDYIAISSVSFLVLLAVLGRVCGVGLRIHSSWSLFFLIIVFIVVFEVSTSS